MVSETTRTRVPVDWLPAGLVSWYAPDGRSLALVTSWMSLSGGRFPRLRAGWPGQKDARSRFWPGGDFVLNVPGEECLPKVRELVNRGQVCFDVTQDLAQQTISSLQVAAPRLHACPLQFECGHGRLDTESFEPEVVGEITLIHRLGTRLDPHVVPDLCALNPLGLSMQNPLV